MMADGTVAARWIDSHGSEATAKAARIAADTDKSGQRPDRLHRKSHINLRKHGTVSSTPAKAAEPAVSIRREDQSDAA